MFMNAQMEPVLRFLKSRIAMVGLIIVRDSQYAFTAGGTPYAAADSKKPDFTTSRRCSMCVSVPTRYPTSRIEVMKVVAFW